jgi:hypothetical protein
MNKPVRVEDVIAEDPYAFPDNVHTWFNLTYANYLVLARTLLQSMSDEWQARFTHCLNELYDCYRHVDIPNTYLVQARGSNGRFIEDPIPHYNRGRAHIEPQPTKWEDR